MKKIKPEILKILNDHKNQKHLVCIVSASPQQWILPWSKRYNVDEVIGTAIDINDGIITGNFASPNCYGKEKVKRFIEKYPDRDKYTLWSYGDSNGDKEIFNFSDYFLKLK